MSATLDVEKMSAFVGASHTTSVQDVSGSAPICTIPGKLFQVQVYYTPSPLDDYIDAVLRTVFQIHYKEPLPGDILCFLTGQDDIQGLSQAIEDFAAQMEKDVPKILVRPLYAALTQAQQELVFEKTPKGFRKIVLATNIAETSVTVSGVRHVIDCGKAKVKRFRHQLGMLFTHPWRIS